jgi:integrase
MGGSSGEYQLGKLGGRYVVTWWETEAGKRSRKRFRLPVDAKRPQAEGIAALNQFIRAREASLDANRGDFTIAELFDRYVDDLRKNGKRNDNQKWIWKSLGPKFGPLLPADIESPVIVEGEERTICHEYAMELARQGLARDTIWDRLSCLRTALNWAKKRNLIDQVPYVWVPAKGKPRDIIWTEEEIIRLLASCESPHVRLFILIAIATGARKTAILQLLWERVDFERRMIDFRDTAERSILEKRRIKGRAVVEFGDAVGIALMEAKDAALTDHVIEFNGKPVGNIKKGLAAAIKRAGLKQFGAGAHVIRHSAATWLADESVDMRKIQKMLGHKDMKTTETIYAKYRRGFLTENANIIDLKLARKAG